MSKAIETLANRVFQHGGVLCIQRDVTNTFWQINVKYPDLNYYSKWYFGLPSDTLDKLANQVNGRIR